MEYVWADTHDRHESILTLASRPFINTTQQRNVMVKNFNGKVTKDDITYWLGDIYWGSHCQELSAFISKLNGTHIGIAGNHDEMNVFAYIRGGFQSFHTYLKVHEFNLIHDPAVCCIKPDEPWLCGHLHSSPENKRHANWLDVGVDGNNFTPYSFDECREYFK